MRMPVTGTYAENEWVRILEPGRCSPSFIPADESLLAVYAGEQGEWPAQAPILSIMVGPFLPGEILPYATC
jgi:hypothetical protein